MHSNLKEQLNFHFEFKEWYHRIIDDFKFDCKKDYRARDYLTSILDSKDSERSLEEVIFSFKKSLQEKSQILIFGCGPSLEKTVEYIIKKRGMEIFKNSFNIAADGAAVFLKKKSIPVTAIFTDLDGITKNEFTYPEFLIIHAHGDNIEKIRYFKSCIVQLNNVIGTTQVESNDTVISPGGFTDGDRIFFFLHTILTPINKLFLIGMDFNNVIGKYSKLHINKNQEGSETKKKKLRYAVELIKWIKKKIKNDISFVNSPLKLNNFNNLTVEEFINNYKNSI